MKVNFVIGGMSMRASTGVFEASRQLALHLLEEGQEIDVFGISDAHTGEDTRLWNPIRPQTFEATIPKRLGYSKAYQERLLASDADLSHLHMLWMYQSAMVHKWHRMFNKPYITTAHGMLDPWAIKNSQLKKRIAYYMYERHALKDCACFHVMTQKEREHVRQFGLKNPVAIIRNGIHIPDLLKTYTDPPWKKFLEDDKKVLLYFGRVHPKKGLMNLVHAISLMKQAGVPELNDWIIVIAGCKPGGEHEQDLSNAISRNHLEQNVLMLGQYYGEERKACYYNSDAYILPSYSEGMPLAALDAWAFGKYSLLTPECNLTDGFDAGISGMIQADPDSIIDGLKGLFSMSPEMLKIKGANARTYVRQAYNWEQAAKKMSELYQWVTGYGEQPSTVSLD